MLYAKGLCLKHYNESRREAKHEWYLRNRELTIERTRKWKAENRDKVRASSLRTWYRYRDRYMMTAREYWLSERGKAQNRLKEQRRNAQKRGATTTNPPTIEDGIEILKQPCAYCGDKAEHIDHVVPLARGGTNNLDNLAPACRHCNLSKGSKLLEKWKQ